MDTKNKDINLDILLYEINDIQKKNKAAIIIQKIIRGYLCRNILSIPSVYQTKKWRKNQKWYINGKHNECELYQRSLFEKITSIKCEKTNIRLNNYDNKLENIVNISKKKDFFEWSENFDGLIKKNNKTFFINFKFVCDEGGAQIRTLREVYHFIYSQIIYINNLEKNNDEIYFINILDGDTCNKYLKYFTQVLSYIKNKKEELIFIGDLYNFEKLWKKKLKMFF
jgi:hypothetical protein